MFDLCGRTAKSVINYCVFYNLDGSEYTVSRIFPMGIPAHYAQRIREFGFSCCDGRQAGERFVLVFTDIDGSLEFVFCHRPTKEFILCLSSSLPWFACFHGLLDIIWFNELYRDSRWHILHPWLIKLVSSAPSLETSSYFECPDPFRSTTNLKFKIPNSYAPHNPKYVMEYYNALDLSMWIHIFVRLILERSVLFHSIRSTRLTSCVLAAVSLLYPLQWVHSFYPLIPKKAIEVLGSPSPFIAGIHTCNLQAAMEYLCPGTCVVNLDSGKVDFPSSQDKSDRISTLTPKAVFHFLRTQLKDVLRQVNSAFSYTNPKAESWKRVDGESCTFFEQLAKPFFSLLLNLLGSYKQCIMYSDEHPEVDIDLLIAHQNCSELSEFLRFLYETQGVQMFFDRRMRATPNPSEDAFESACNVLHMQRKMSKSGKAAGVSKRSLQGSTPNHLVPLAEVVNGTLNSSLSYDSPLFVLEASKEWSHAKKIRSPGELCTWEYKKDWTDAKNIHSPTHTGWAHKLRAHASALKNLSRSKDTLPTDNGPTTLSTHANDPSEKLPRSQSFRNFSKTMRPKSVAQKTLDDRSRDVSSSCQDLLDVDPKRKNYSQGPPPIAPSNFLAVSNGTVSKPSKDRPPRPPPPRFLGRYRPQSVLVHENSAKGYPISDQKSVIKPPRSMSSKSATLDTRVGASRFSHYVTGVDSPLASYSHDVRLHPTVFDQRPISNISSLRSTSHVLPRTALVPQSQLLTRRMNRWSEESLESPSSKTASTQQLSSGDDSATSTISRNSSDSQQLDPLKAGSTEFLGKLGTPSVSPSESLRCMAIGDTTNTWDKNNAVPNPTEDLARYSSGDRHTDMRKRWATFSHIHKMLEQTIESHQLTSPTKTKSWSNLNA